MRSVEIETRSLLEILEIKATFAIFRFIKIITCAQNNNFLDYFFEFVNNDYCHFWAFKAD